MGEGEGHWLAYIGKLIVYFRLFTFSENSNFSAILNSKQTKILNKYAKILKISDIRATLGIYLASPLLKKVHQRRAVSLA